MKKKKRVAINETNRLINLKEAIGDRLPGTLDLPSMVKYSKALAKAEVNASKKK